MQFAYSWTNATTTTVLKTPNRKNKKSNGFKVGMESPHVRREVKKKAAHEST